MCVIWFALMLGGCSAATVDRSLTDSLSGNEPAAQMEFWHTLSEQRITSNDDALHGVLLFADGQDPVGDYEARVQNLKDRGWLPAQFDQPANQAISRGTLAVILVKLLDIKGGLTMRLIGPRPRYAVRELRFVGLYPPSSPHQTFTGQQFVSLIGRVEDYQRTQELQGSP